MPECHDLGADARRPFLVAPYVAAPEGQLVASVPPSCPWREGGEGCRLSVDHHRDRKTGPCFALVVVRCGLHGRRFTLYPPGHVPYGRVAVAPVSADGGLVRAAPPREAPPPEPKPAVAAPGQLAWPSTVFGAAIDAAAGQAWPRQEPARWRTQGRWLGRGARLLGIEPEPGGEELRHGEQRARQLRVPTLVLVDGARRFREARGYRERGEAILAVLAAMEGGRTLGDRLLSAGAIAGLWGRPSRWDP